MLGKDEAVARLLRLTEYCDTATVARVADQLEETVEMGAYEGLQRPSGELPAVQEWQAVSGAYEPFATAG